MGSNVGKIHVHVLDEIYELIGEVSSSSSDGDSQVDIQLENYLTNNNVISPDYQGMARGKQTIRKQVNCGQPAVNSVVQLNELDSDSSLERAYNAVNKDSNDKDMGSKGPGASSGVSRRHGRSRGLSTDEGDGSGSGQRRQIESESSEEEETPESSEESMEEE